jgi:hypothetical protein
LRLPEFRCGHCICFGLNTKKPPKWRFFHA